MYSHKILKLKYSRIFATLMALVLILGTTPSFTALPENTYDLSYQAGDDPDTFYHWAEFDGVFWEVYRPDGSAGTGVFDSFLRIQANGIEKGYNTNGPVEFDTKSGTWTRAITMSEIPYGTSILNEGTPNEITYSGFEFMIDINESNPKSIMNVDQYQFWLTGNPNLTGYAPVGEGQSMQWSLGNDEPVWIGEIDWDFSSGQPIDRQLIMDYLVNSGSGAADYRVLIPEDYFFNALSRYNDIHGIELNMNEAYLVLYVEHSEADAGFEEWGVRVVEKGSLTITKNFSGYPQGYELPEVIVNVTNGMGYSKDITLNLSNNWTATETGLMPGIYTVTEYDVIGWTTSYPAGNSVEVVANVNSNIEIDNTLDVGYIEISKSWDDMGTGIDLPESVSVLIKDSENVTVDTLVLTELNMWTDTSVALVPGTYTVVEETIYGWTTTMDPIDGVVVVTPGSEEDAVIVNITNQFNMVLMSETAWGYLAGSSMPILDYVNSNNWGWTTPITGTGTYIFDLYAAAGQNILSNGTLVGTVEVIVTNGTAAGLYNVEVTYIIDQTLDYDYWLDEVHVWIGATELPVQNKNKMTNSPGQFNYSPTISLDGYEATVTAYDVEGPFWIALHSVVQWWE